MPAGRAGDGEADGVTVEDSGVTALEPMGLAMMRYVWRVEPVASMSEDDLVATIAPNLQRYVDGRLSSRGGEALAEDSGAEGNDEQ